jgi:predicted short-subunit dehydrogenase-like oxidoreductase (DUF2520 family)
VPSLGASSALASAFDAAPWVVLATRDQDVAPVALALAMRDGWAGRVVLHVSGSLASDVLEPLALAGAETGSFHPLLSLRGEESGARAFVSADVFGEGTPGAEEAGRRLAAALGARWRRIEPGLKPLYHAAATLAGNLAPVLCAVAARVLRERGVDGMEAPLARLAASGLEGVVTHRGLGGLTGPVARGDSATLRENARALGELPDEAALCRAHAAVSLLAIDELRRVAGRELRDGGSSRTAGAAGSYGSLGDDSVPPPQGTGDDEDPLGVMETLLRGILRRLDTHA